MQQLTPDHVIFYSRTPQCLRLRSIDGGGADADILKHGILIREHPPRVFHVQPDASRMELQDQLQDISTSSATEMLANLLAQAEDKRL